MLHTFAAGLLVAAFASIATWAVRHRILQATAVGLGLMTASILLVRLSGYIEFHFHFFLVIALSALYRDWLPYIVGLVYVGLDHGFLGPSTLEVYSQAGAVYTPWTWTGIHSVFVLAAAGASILSWRFNEAAAAHTTVLLDCAGEGIITLDNAGDITFINPAASHMLDVDREVVLGRSIETIQNFTAGTIESKIVSEIVRTRADQITRRGSGLLTRGDGQVFTVDFTVTSVGVHGEIGGVVVTLSDVTSHKAAEEAVSKKVEELARANAEARAMAQEQEALNRVAGAISQSLHREELLEIALQKVLEVTRRERVSIRLKDPATERVTLVAHRGFSSDEVEQLHGAMHHAPTDRVLASGQPLVVDNSRVQKQSARLLLPRTGSVAWIPMKAGANIIGILGVSGAAPISFAQREVEFLQSIASMVGVALENARLFSETEARFQELQILQEISQVIFESIDVKVMMEELLGRVFTIGRFDVGLVRLLNAQDGTWEPVASRGYRDPSNVGSHRTRFDESTNPNATSRVIDEKKVNVVDLADSAGMRTFKKEGVRMLAAIPLRNHDDVLGVIQLGCRTRRQFHSRELGVLEAIASQAGIAIQKARLYEESRKAQEALAAKAEELVRSNTELQHFAYIASHDLQEPLRMVASYVQLLARRYKAKLDADANEFIDFAVDGATRMQALINALLEYSRIGTKGKPFQPAACEKILQIALKNLEVALRESGAMITHDPLPEVLGDATQLAQLFQNLIANAIKFRGDKPPAVHICAERMGKDWCFRFRDNGIGIDPQFSERIFVIFQRLHSKEEYPGTGIGLALCKKIVERHGGRIWVQSKPGQGATFHFTIPHVLFSFFQEVSNHE